VDLVRPDRDGRQQGADQSVGVLGPALEAEAGGRLRRRLDPVIPAHANRVPVVPHLHDAAGHPVAALHTRLHHIRADALDGDTAQTGGMRRFAAVSGRTVGSEKLWTGQTHVASTSSSDHHPDHTPCGMGTDDCSAEPGQSGLNSRTA
jgi:hypothetical protein